MDTISLLLCFIWFTQSSHIYIYNLVLFVLWLISYFVMFSIFILQLFRRVAAALPGMEQETKKPGESILLSNHSVTVLLLMPEFLTLLQLTATILFFFPPLIFITINCLFLLTSAIVLLL